eukprot:gene3342-3831_t
MAHGKCTRNISRLVFPICLLIFSYNLFNFYKVRRNQFSSFSQLAVRINATIKNEREQEDSQVIDISKELMQELNKDAPRHCDFPWIGHNSSLSSVGIKCQPVGATEEECNEANRMYKDPSRKKNCPEGKNLTPADICWFSNSSYRLAANADLKLKCDTSICQGKPVRVGGIHMRLGVLPDMEQWAIARTRQELVMHINGLIKYMISSSIDYVYLGCKVKQKTIKQVLVLPPLLRQQSSMGNGDAQNLPNVNILVLDSVSREHFFRKLPLTAEFLKGVNKDTNTRSSLLDFELFQSLAPRTFPNIRALFSGEVDKDSEDTEHSYNIEKLFGKFVNHGYQTMLQEDSCWFDSWGALITDNIHDLTPMISSDAFMKRWGSLNKRLRSMQVSNFGLTHLSCEALLQYGVTNQFNEPPKVCYNGKFLTSYFLKYVSSHFVEVRDKVELKPLLLYTHLNTGHEKTGHRISYLDEELTEHVRKMSKQRDTITIILSDHGPKTTQFGRENARGRYELAHSFMFMLIPEGIQTRLAERYDALLLNQKRLTTLRDLHFTLVSLLDGTDDGLFSPLDPNRGCHDLPLYSFTQCLCSGWKNRLPDSGRSVVWIAEFATGFLNNLIQFMYRIGNPTQAGGYGNCERLIGKRFTNVRTRKESRNIIYNFDVVVYRYWGEEMFEFAISQKTYNQNRRGLLDIIQWRRVSIYQHFRKCLDNNVKPELCICRPESAGMNPGRHLVSLLSSKFFDTKTRTSFLDSRCLALLTRTRSRSHKVYEISNFCSDRRYTVSFDLNKAISELTLISTVLPINITVFPWTTHFLTSISIEKIDEESLNDFGNLEIITFVKI